MTRLPRVGRQGPPPPWPLDIQPSPVELRKWERLWALPQAVAWETLEWADAVARYVLILTMANLCDPKMLAEARQMEDRLGLNPLALLRLRWEIVDEEEARERPQVVDIRERLRAVE
jgi:hypothetical protein